MKKFITKSFMILVCCLIPMVTFMFVDGELFVENVKRFIKFMMSIDVKYIPFLVSIVITLIVFFILIHLRKKIKRNEDDEGFEQFLMQREEIFYMQVNDLISKFKTYTIGNNDEHEKIIKSFNEALKGTVDNLQKGDYIPKEAIVEIGKDERVKIAFDDNKKHIEREREKLKELFDKRKINESNRDNK